MLGGRNTGKTFVMERLEQKVIVVNLRRNSDILRSLVEKLWERRLSYKPTDFNNAMLKFLVGIFYKWTDGKVKENMVSQADYQMVVDAVIKKPAALSCVLEDISIGYDGITLIVDEANIAFTIKDFTTAAEIKAATETLNAFTRLTKETQTVFFIIFIMINLNELIIMHVCTVYIIYYTILYS